MASEMGRRRPVGADRDRDHPRGHRDCAVWKESSRNIPPTRARGPAVTASRIPTANRSGARGTNGTPLWIPACARCGSAHPGRCESRGPLERHRIVARAGPNFAVMGNRPSSTPVVLDVLLDNGFLAPAPARQIPEKVLPLTSRRPNDLRAKGNGKGLAHRGQQGGRPLTGNVEAPPAARGAPTTQL